MKIIRAVGIDLGTTNSAVSAMIDAYLDPLAFAAHDRQAPQSQLLGQPREPDGHPRPRQPASSCSPPPSPCGQAVAARAH